MQKLSLILLLIIFSFSVLGQDDKILTNTDIVEMSKTGLPPTVIISKIKTSKVDFKTEIPDLKLLIDEKVSDVVIAAMVEKQAEKKQPPKEIRYSNQEAEYGKIDELKGKVKVFLAVEDAEARKHIVEQIKKNSTLKIVETRKEADFGLYFNMWQVDKGSNVLMKTVHNVVLFGEMQVYFYLPIPDNATVGRLRILWQKRKQQDFTGGFSFDKHPAKQVINDFLKELKRIK